MISCQHTFLGKKLFVHLYGLKYQRLQNLVSINLDSHIVLVTLQGHSLFTEVEFM